MSRPLRAWVVGSTNVDLVLSVEHLPLPGETVLVQRATRAAGGKGGNQAVALARLGADVVLVSAVGDDEDGRWSLARLIEEGVDVSLVAVVGAPTGRAVVSVEASGENAIMVIPGANAHVEAPKNLAGADVLLLSLEVPMPTVAHAAQAGRRAGVPVVLNAAPARPLPEALLRDVDVLVVNEMEWEQVGTHSVDAVVVTLGARGALVHRGEQTVTLAAPAVTAVDTTGAGDCFAATLAHGVGSRIDLVESARRACAAAALSVTGPGARASRPAVTRDSAS